MNYKIRLISLGLAIAFLPISVIASPSQNSDRKSDSEPQKTTSSTNNSISNSFKPPNQGQPRYTVGGATRGDSCGISQEDGNKMIALVPTENQSLTLHSHPNFFAYVSPMYGDKSAVLVVKDEAEDYYYSQQLTVPVSGGIVKMTLAEDAPPLEVNKDYIWFLRIQCNIDLEPEDPQIGASIMRVEGNTPDLIKSDLVSFYANSQVWYDSLNSAFELYQSGDDVYLYELLDKIEFDRSIAR